MRAFATIGVLASFLALGGCVSETTVMKLNADGSGAITVTTTMKTAAIERMKEMAKQFSQGFGGEAAKEPEFFSEKQAREKAAKMGEGVAFVSCEKIKAKGEEGLKAFYSFKDVTKLKISEQSEPPGGGGPGGFQVQAGKGDPITFKFAKQAGGSLLLTVVNPKMDGEKKETPPAPAGGTPEVPEEQLAMMKEIMGGLKISIQLEVAGKIVKTNSPHVDGNKVTIMEIDFDKIIADLPKFKKLAGAQPKSLDEAKALMKDFPGVKANLERETTVEFTGN